MKTVFVVHHFADPEEIFSIALILLFGRQLKKFDRLDSNNWGIEFYDPSKDYHTFGRQNDIRYHLLGVGGGVFDEHARQGQERKKDPCIVLVAKFLWDDKIPSTVQPFIKELAAQDRCEGKVAPTDMKELTIAMLNDATSAEHEAEITMQLVQLYMKTYQYKLDLFLQGRQKHLVKTLAEGTVTVKGKVYKVSMVESNNELRNIGDGTHVVIVKRKKYGQGHWAIARKNADFPMELVVSAIRNAEATAKFGTAPTCIKAKAGMEGDVRGVDCWFYYAQTGGLFNGAKKYPDAAKSVLTDDQIYAAVMSIGDPEPEKPVPVEKLETNDQLVGV